ncbi:hypothetical protein [Nocardioides pyridinolyticus]
MSDLGPMPDPEIEPGEPNPGGVDAIDADTGPVAIPDLTPDENPAVDDQVPDSLVEQMSGGEDTSTKATESADGETGEPDEPEEESPV